MKKLFLLVLPLLFTLMSFAQGTYTMTISATDDTLAASATGVATITISGKKGTLGFHAWFTEVNAGTNTMAGTATLQVNAFSGSTEWITCPGTTAYTIVDGNNGTGWAIQGNPYRRYRIRIVNNAGGSTIVPLARVVVQ